MDPRLTKLVESLELSKVLMIKICQAFQRHLSQGLLIHKNGGIPGEDVSICSLKMLDSCITNIPSGKETGVCYGLDFGGSNFRAVKAVLCGKGRIEIFQNSASLKESFQGHCPEGLVHAEVPGTHLFDRFSLQLKDLIDHREDTPMECSMNAENNPAVVPLGFTFSFPCLQESLNAARLITWTKEIETGRATECKVEGKDVAKMLQEAFLRHSIPARVFAVINDTVGTLISCAYQKSEDDPDCLIGLILGTGSNVCYYEPMAQEFNYKGNVINLEYGSFFDPILPRNEVDIELDRSSSNPGGQSFEKLVSGRYIGELVQKYCMKLDDPAVLDLLETYILDTKDAAALATLETSNPTSSNIVNTMKRILPSSTVNILKALSLAIFNRSADLISCSLAATVLRIITYSPEISRLSIGVDGSLILKNEFYFERVTCGISSLIESAGKKCDVKLIPTDDGSGKGAALVAFVASRS